MLRAYLRYGQSLVPGCPDKRGLSVHPIFSCVHAAYEQMHTFCMHVFCTPHVLVCGIHDVRFNFCVCSTHGKNV